MIKRKRRYPLLRAPSPNCQRRQRGSAAGPRRLHHDSGVLLRLAHRRGRSAWWLARRCSTRFAAGCGATSTARRGRIALALTAVSWGMLGYLYRRNAQSQPFFEDPLREALGEDYEARRRAERAQATRLAGCSARRGRAAGTSRRPTSSATARTGRTSPTSGAAPTCPATVRRRCCCRCPAARGRSGCAARRPTR